MQKQKKWIPRLLIGVTVAFLALFLVVPLVFVLVQAFSAGLGVYLESITDTYALQALVLTMITVLVAVAVNTIFGYIYRSAIVSVSGDCGIDFYFDLWSFQSDLSAADGGGDSCGLRHPRHFAGYDFCHLSLYFQGDHSHFGGSGYR